MIGIISPSLPSLAIEPALGVVIIGKPQLIASQVTLAEPSVREGKAKIEAC